MPEADNNPPTSPATPPSPPPAPPPAPPSDSPSPGAEGARRVEESRSSTAPSDHSDGRRVIGDPDAPLTAMGDPSGEATNRLGGTIQSEPRPEDLPPDAKIAPIAEQVAPNQAAQAVGALPTPDEIAGIPQPAEGEKNPVSDGSDPKQFLSETSNQGPAADRAAAQSEVAADEARQNAEPARNTDGSLTEQ